jgi:hypothetical protein
MKKLTSIAALYFSMLPAFAGNDLPSAPDSTVSNTFSIKSTHDDGGAKGKIMVTAGVGFNFTQLNYVVRYESSGYFISLGDGPVISKVSSMPLINIMADYGIGERVSVGVAGGYQKTTVYWGDGSRYFNMTDDWTRIHIAVRGDYRIIAKKDLGLYTGVKIGFNKYTMVSSTFQAVDPNYINNMHLNLSPVSIQAHFGVSYWFSGIAGLNAEVGIGYGGPYVFAIGATAKF